MAGNKWMYRRPGSEGTFEPEDCGIYRHYTASERLSGAYPASRIIDTSAPILPPALRMKMKPGDKVEYLERDEAGAWAVVTTWDVITELVERPGRGMGKGGLDA